MNQDGPPSKDQNPFLLIEDNLGIPQKVLYRTFSVALEVFKRCRTASDNSDGATQSSAVLLLTNPGHQTALNTRKRLVLSGKLKASHELLFTAALLSHRECAKQSILWHHRRWLLRYLFPSRHPDAPRRTEEIQDEDSLSQHCIPIETIALELEIASKGSGTYPRNYFAWSHRFRCLDLLGELVWQGIHQDSTLNLLKGECIWTRQWIERHISDYSAMQYHQRLSHVVQALEPNVQLSLSGVASLTLLHLHALPLVQSFPGHEALWIYLRNCVGDPPFSGMDGGTQKVLRDLVQESLTTSPSVKRRHASRVVLGMSIVVSCGALCLS